MKYNNRKATIVVNESINWSVKEISSHNKPGPKSNNDSQSPSNQAKQQIVDIQVSFPYIDVQQKGNMRIKRY